MLDISTYPPVIAPAAGQGAPLNTTFGRPYNNVSIPGANVADTFTVTGAVAKPTRGVEQLAQFILRGPVTEVDAVVAQKPTFILVWIGGNDFLGSATNGTTAGLTPLAAFTTAYNTMLDRLVATGAGVVVGTLPTNPGAVPFFNTVPTVLINPATRTPVLGPTGQPITLIGQVDGTPAVGQLLPGSFITLGASSLLAQGFGIPAALKPVLDPTNKLPLFGTPLPDAVILTPAARERIAFLAGEPDRWRNTDDLSLAHANGPDHYLDLDQLADYGLTPIALPAASRRISWPAKAGLGRRRSLAASKRSPADFARMT